MSSTTVVHIGTVQFGGAAPENEVIHLEAERSGTTLCGISLFPVDDAGRRVDIGWGRGGGHTGPKCRRVPCPTCRDAVPEGRYTVITDRTFNLDWKKP